MVNRYPIPTIRSGFIGIVSGMKGGAPAGALMGAAAMFFATADTPIPSLWLYTIVVGLTLGLMGGATFGAAYGFLSGLISNRPLQNGSKAVSLIWYGLALLFFIPILFFMSASYTFLTALTSLACGLLMGYLAHREFLKVWLMQQDVEEETAV